MPTDAADPPISRVHAHVAAARMLIIGANAARQRRMVEGTCRIVPVNSIRPRHTSPLRLGKSTPVLSSRTAAPLAGQTPSRLVGGFQNLAADRESRGTEFSEATADGVAEVGRAFR
jgi:hypothetical protein